MSQREVSQINASSRVSVKHIDSFEGHTHG